MGVLFPPLALIVAALPSLKPKPIAHREPDVVAGPQVVVLIHGIRTHASWAEMVAQRIRTNIGSHVEIIKYDYYDLFSFLCPILTRRAPIEKISIELEDIQKQYPDARISVIAHSFGTYALMEALKRVDIRLGRVVLCGSVLETSFRKGDIKNLPPPVAVLNECSGNDILPILAGIFSWGYGAAGTWGIGTAGVRNRHHAVGHSGYFKEKFVDCYWIPFLKDGSVVDSPLDIDRPPIENWKSLASKVPGRWLWFTPVLLLFYAIAVSLAYQPVYGAPIVSVSVGHILGRPFVWTTLVFPNRRASNMQLSILNSYLVGPSGQTVPLNMGGFSAGSTLANLGDMLHTNALNWTISGYDTGYFRVHYLHDSVTVARLTHPAERSCEGKDKGNPLSGTKLLPPDIVEAATKEAREHFGWVEGTWKFVLDFETTGPVTREEREFTLAADHIAGLRRNIDFYETGVGLCGNWKFSAILDATPLLEFGASK
jgi:hypothetical protein